MRKKIRISESQMRRIIAESVRKVLNEKNDPDNFYRINIQYYVDGLEQAFVFPADPNDLGYRGYTTGTRYADGGEDGTYWGAFFGTKEECEEKAAKFNEKKWQEYQQLKKDE